MAKINDAYDIGAAFEAIEDELIASMIRNMKRHKVEEVTENKQWSMWQAERLKALEQYRRANRKKFGGQFQDINDKIEALIRVARTEGNMHQELQILDAIKKGFPAKKATKGATAEFFRLNDRKLDALINATTNDMEKAEVAVLRMADDQYRRVIYNAQVYANTGAGTYEKAVDMATKDFLSAGLNCIEYKNGARHTLADYADMAIRTASKRAYLQGEGEKRQEWGIHTVIVNKRGNPCPKCLPFCGKVLIDDVWSGGSRKDGSYPLVSKAISYGLYHPRCKDSHTTYFPGISTADDTWTKEELEQIGLKNQQEARQQYAKRQEKKYKRMAECSLDLKNKAEYQQKSNKWARLKDDEGIYHTYNLGQNDVIKPHNIKKDMQKSDIGKEMSEYLETNNILVQLVYGIDNPYNELGFYDAEDDVIRIFADQTKTIEKTAEVLIHEATHRKYGIGGDQWSEAVCIAQEVKHRKRSNTLTSQEKKDILKLVAELYPEYPWRK